jgi:hypothetical protein
MYNGTIEIICGVKLRNSLSRESIMASSVVNTLLWLLSFRNHHHNFSIGFNSGEYDGKNFIKICSNGSNIFDLCQAA